jgi:fructan beta-fructosidase
MFRDLSGNFNLFYLHNSDMSDESKTKDVVNWGHATSRDLVHWHEEELVFRGTKDKVFKQGSMVVDFFNSSQFYGDPTAPPYCAIYTMKEKGKTGQNLACSSNWGATWTDYPENPVLEGENMQAPNVIYHPQINQWVMTLTATKPKKLIFYQSKNLRDWRHTGDFTLNDAIQTKFLETGEEGAEWKSAEMFPLYNSWTD